MVRWLVTQFFGNIEKYGQFGDLFGFPTAIFTTGVFDWEKYGQFGDSFGFLTAVFTAGAFFLLWKTYKTQQEELRETRKSLDLQRHEMELARQSMDMQRFDSTFFNIWRFYIEAVWGYQKYFPDQYGTKRMVYGSPAIMETIWLACQKVMRQGAADSKVSVESVFTIISSDVQSLYKKLVVLLLVVSEHSFEVKNAHLKIILSSVTHEQRVMAALVSCSLKDTQIQRLVGKYLIPENYDNPFMPKYANHPLRSILIDPIEEAINAAKV